MDWIVIEKILDVGSRFYFRSFDKEVDFILVLELTKQESKQRNKTIKLLHVIGMWVHLVKWGYEIM